MRKIVKKKHMRGRHMKVIETNQGKREREREREIEG
jgi:hypothetical protein